MKNSQVNLAEKHKQAAISYLGKLRSNKEIIGCVLTGGAARGYADSSSDIDITFFVKNKEFNKIRSGERIVDGFDFDISVVPYEVAEKHEWDQVQKWTYKQGEILSDSRGRIRKLLRRKLRYSEKERRDIIVDRTMRLAWYGINYRKGRWKDYEFFRNPFFWVQREDIASAHIILNYCLDMYLDMLFAYNRQFIPDEKWKLHESRKLEWLPKDFDRRINETIQIKSFTKEDFSRRLKPYKAMYDETVGAVEDESLLPKNIYKHLLRHSDYYSTV